MQKTIIFTFILSFCFLWINTKAQITESFNDGDFTDNPIWIGNTGDWIVNPIGQLQSNDTIANSTFYLSTANSLATSAQWEFYVKLAFNTSSANYVDAFLIASSSDLSAIKYYWLFCKNWKY
ncbi:MAG: hypothetical protein WKG06_25875 [Segetibacter sp.]